MKLFLFCDKIIQGDEIMNKRIIFVIVVLLSIITLTGCNLKEKPKNDSGSEHNTKSLVIYFSATGTTRMAAERIAGKSNSDIIEIIPKEKYTDSDLDYKNSDCRASKEQNDSNARPEIENKIDISKYSTIYLGYPIWYGSYPKIIQTLLDTYDFTGKTIIPFCTSGSTSITQSVNDLRNNNTKLTIKDGRRFSLSDSEKALEEYINSNK